MFSVIPDDAAGQRLYFQEWDYPVGMSLCVCMEQPEEQEIWRRTEQGLVLTKTDTGDYLGKRRKKTDKIGKKIK